MGSQPKKKNPFAAFPEPVKEENWNELGRSLKRLLFSDALQPLLREMPEASALTEDIWVMRRPWCDTRTLEGHMRTLARQLHQAVQQADDRTARVALEGLVFGKTKLLDRMYTPVAERVLGVGKACMEAYMNLVELAQLVGLCPDQRESYEEAQREYDRMQQQLEEDKENRPDYREAINDLIKVLIKVPIKVPFHMLPPHLITPALKELHERINRLLVERCRLQVWKCLVEQREQTRRWCLSLLEHSRQVLSGLQIDAEPETARSESERLLYCVYWWKPEVLAVSNTWENAEWFMDVLQQGVGSKASMDQIQEDTKEHIWEMKKGWKAMAAQWEQLRQELGIAPTDP